MWCFIRIDISDRKSDCIGNVYPMKDRFCQSYDKKKKQCCIDAFVIECFSVASEIKPTLISAKFGSTHHR